METTSHAVASPFLVSKLKREAARNWDIFWKEHQNKFFHNRYWTDQEFNFDALIKKSRPNKSVISDDKDEENKKQETTFILEVGCGAGNFLYPILNKYPSVHAFACDFSPRAVNLLTENPSFDKNRTIAFVHDISKTPTDDENDNFSKYIKNQRIDIIVCLFVLSSIPPEKHAQTLNNLVNVLSNDGGYLLFRDYALGDPAQNRFHTRRSASYSDPSLLSADEPLYRRSDGTLSYFFTPEQIHSYLGDSGLCLEGQCTIVERPMSNRKEGIDLTRKFVQGVYRKV